MTRSRAGWALCAAVGLCGAGGFARQPAQVQPPPSAPAGQVVATSDIFKGTPDDLKGHLFHVDGLNISLEMYTPGFAAYIHLQVKNPTAHFLPFHPEDLTVVGPGNDQWDLVITVGGPERLPMLDVLLYHLAPGAISNRYYDVRQIVGGFQYPFKIYFDEKPLAEITKPEPRIPDTPVDPSINHR